MRKARVVLAALFGAAMGCAAVIDLGDEAKLRSAAEAGAPVVETGADARADGAAGSDAAPPGVCGLPDSPNADCAACIQQQCCDISKACATDPTCVAGLQCVKDCLVQVECIVGCAQRYPSITNETNCSAMKCPKCTPGPQCSRLGQCVFDLPDASLLRQVEEGRILELDEDACKSSRQQVAGAQADASACFAN